MASVYQGPDKFNFYVSVAFVSHFVIALLLFFAPQLFKSKVHIPNNIELIKSSVRVDIVGMPKQTLQELKKIKKLAPSKPIAQEPTKPKPAKVNETSKVEFKKVGKKINLSNLLGSFSKKKIPKAKAKTNKKKINQKELKQLILEGNQVSKGSSATGDKSELSERSFIGYLQSLPSLVRPYWKLPSYLMQKNLQCRVQVFINREGQILKTKIFESSGVKEYDEKALKAVLASSPLTVPPKDILGRLVTGEVILGFPL